MRGRSFAGASLVCSCAIIAVAGCLSGPTPAKPDDAGGDDDAAVGIDAALDAGPAPDAGQAPDAAPVTGGAEFPPTSTAVTITGGWSGDLNGDGIDDVVLLSDTGAADSAGVYVLMGQAELGVPEYHQFLATDTRDPLAVTATQLDGAGGLDLVLFAVDYASPGAYTDNESYLYAFLASGAQLSEPPLVNHITAGGELNYLFPRTEGEEAGVVAARIDPDATVPGIAVFHERGSFAIVRPSWDSATWASATPLELQYTYAATGAAAFPSEATGVDDLIAFTDSMPQMTWLVNDGSGSFSERTVEGVAPGVALGVLAELTGAAPPDVIGAGNSCLQATPIDTDSGTAGALRCVDGIGKIRGVHAFDTDAPGTGTPELIAIADAPCDAVGGNGCLYLLPDAYIDDGGAALAGGTARYRALPAGFAPRFAARGDFDGDGADELRVFAVDGQQVCAVATGGNFADCP